jgi:hypothetical protein
MGFSCGKKVGVKKIKWASLLFYGMATSSHRPEGTTGSK